MQLNACFSLIGHEVGPSRLAAPKLRARSVAHRIVSTRSRWCGMNLARYAGPARRRRYQGDGQSPAAAALNWRTGGSLEDHEHQYRIRPFARRELAV